MSDNKLRVCFFHGTDLDGHCSGAVFALAAKKLGWTNTKLIGYVYEDKIDIEALKGADVYFVDCTPSPMAQWLPKISAVADSLFVIDHHESSIKDPLFQQYCSKGNSRVGLDAGCALAWEYWKDVLGDMPVTVRLLSDYDTWNQKDKKRWDSEILPFQFGFKIYQTNPTKPKNLDFWNTVFSNAEKFVKPTIEHGFTILKYERGKLAKAAHEASFEAMLKDYKAICLNTTDKRSQSFDSIYDPNKHDIMVAFSLSPGDDGLQVNVSFYTTKDSIKVNELAKEWGGGGHKGAAGCRVKRIELKDGELILE